MPSYQSIDVHKAKDLFAQKRCLIVDIRATEDFKKAHIPDAVSVSDANVKQFLSSADKTRPLVCYCYHGISSRSAAEFFSQNGFPEVFSLAGGFEEWRGTYPVVAGPVPQ